MYEDYIADRVSRLRNQKAISARDMSLKLGQSENYINMIENKNSLPSMIGFLNICDFLQISPRDFFAEEKQNPEKLNALINEAEKLSDDVLDHILDILRDLNK